MPFVQRKAGAICGCFAELQPGLAEEFLQDTDSQVIAYLNPPGPTVDQMEADALAALNGGAASINVVKLLKAKFISDLAFRLAVAPAALTLAQINAERSRIAAIYKNL